MTDATIPLKHIGEMHILVSDVVAIFKNGVVLRKLADYQLTDLQGSIDREIERRKNTGPR